MEVYDMSRTRGAIIPRSATRKSRRNNVKQLLISATRKQILPARITASLVYWNAFTPRPSEKASLESKPAEVLFVDRLRHMLMQSSRVFARHADSIFVAINVLRDSQIINRAQFSTQKKAEEFTVADLQLALQHEDTQLLGQLLQYEASTLTGTPPVAIRVMVKNLDYDTEHENVKQRYEEGERLEFNKPMLELCELYQEKVSAAGKQGISRHSIGNVYLNSLIPLAKASGLGEPAYISDALLDSTLNTLL
jgi:hypothetical protein